MYNFATDKELVIDCFDKLIAQGGCSVRDGRCTYRGEGGRKCAAGLYIPDELYSDKFEDKSCYELPYPWNSRDKIRETIMRILRKNGLKPESLRILQTIHDNISGWSPRDLSNRDVEFLRAAKAKLLTRLKFIKTLKALNVDRFLDRLSKELGLG